MCGRRLIGKDFFDVAAALVGAVMCAACSCSAHGRSTMSLFILTADQCDSGVTSKAERQRAADGFDR
jgi:hypothetical protein